MTLGLGLARKKIQAGFDTVWDSWVFGWICVFIFASLSLYWLARETPTPGRAVAVLAVAAALMSVRANAGGLEVRLDARFVQSSMDRTESY
jgi:hypothetical protein